MIESSGANCSVALGNKGKLIDFEDVSGLNHAEKLAVLVQQILLRNQINVEHLDAVAVGIGPGSYTGLRIGVATAKGICYGAQLPLIGINSLETLLHQSLSKLPQADFYIPMFDARRMEVYQQVYDKNLIALTSVEAKIIETNSFEDYTSKGKTVVFGNAAEKVKNFIGDIPNLYFHTIEEVSAKGMFALAQSKFEKALFEDIAYFEPLYLKDFLVTKAKNPL